MAERRGPLLTVKGNEGSVGGDDGDEKEERKENDGLVGGDCGGGEAVAALGALMPIVVCSLSETRLTAAF